MAFLLFQIPSDAVLSSTLSSSLGGSEWATSPRHPMDITMPLSAQAPGLRNVSAEGRGVRIRGARMALGLGTRSCMLHTVQVQQPGTCPCSAPDWVCTALHSMGSDFHECPRETCAPMPIHVNFNQPLQAACAALETSIHNQPPGNQWLAARTPWFTCLPEGDRRCDTAPLCHSLHAPLWGRHPAPNAPDSPGQVTRTPSWDRQKKQK